MHDRARQLLTQLVNAPSSLSRNRNFSLFEEPRAEDIRRRAIHLRMIRDALLQKEATLERAHESNGRMMLRLKYESGLTQRTWLEYDEAAVLKASLWSEADAELRRKFDGWAL